MSGHLGLRRKKRWKTGENHDTRLILQKDMSSKSCAVDSGVGFCHSTFAVINGEFSRRFLYNTHGNPTDTFTTMNTHVTWRTQSISKTAINLFLM